MIEEIFINKNVNIRDALKKLDDTAKKILFVTEDNKLIGSITDGDIRRGILKSGDLSLSICNIMNSEPISINNNQRKDALAIMLEKQIEAIPIVDDDRVIIDVEFLYNKSEKTRNDKITTPVVIMAGGKGTRLYPYTKILPKPLIPIGDISIVERIINRFIDVGCNVFYLTINYKKNMIKAYFDELEKSYELKYIEESKFLGTGGSLSLIRQNINETFFLSNCDILIEADYTDILKYHRQHKNLITIVTSLKQYRIPYGVIKLNEDGGVINSIEKPEYNYLVNTGFYVLEPQVLSDVPKNEFFHITDLIDKYISEGKKVGTYPITENAWLDMGEIKEMERMIERLNL